MPAPTAIPTPSSGHRWHMRFDAVRCRNCDAPMKFFEDVERPCPGAAKILPIAGIRQASKKPAHLSGGGPLR